MAVLFIAVGIAWLAYCSFSVELVEIPNELPLVSKIKIMIGLFMGAAMIGIGFFTLN